MGEVAETTDKKNMRFLNVGHWYKGEADSRCREMEQYRKSVIGKYEMAASFYNRILEGNTDPSDPAVLNARESLDYVNKKLEHLRVLQIESG